MNQKKWSFALKSIKYNLFVLFVVAYSAQSATNSLKVAQETLKIDPDSFYDTTFDYSSFSGRVTDRDATSSIIKISSENHNVKFFRAGDLVEFKIQNSTESKSCQGYVRSIEETYFVIFVKDLFPCFPKEEYFRRGTALIMKSEKLLTRVREASVFRASLLNKKKDFMGQLNNINQDVWNFEERKIQVAAEYDKKIAEIEKEKLKALDQLLAEKNDQLRLQRELTFRLDNIDKELIFYRVEKQEMLFDRWHLDHDLGYPVYEKPSELRPIRASGESTID